MLKVFSWTAFLLFPISIFALPKGAAPVSGQVQVKSLSSSKMAVHASDRSVIHWDQFSINAGEEVKFVQPHAGAASFNHVVGGEASQILGMLKANGHVYLINPNGILIGKSGVINAAGFTASTLDLLDQSKGELHFKEKSPAQVINYGRVEALEGDVVFIGSSVVNGGDLIASKGAVALGAGSEIILRPEVEERLFIVPKLNMKKEGTGVDNKGSIQAAKAELKADGNVYKMAINHSGVIEAGELQEENGRIMLVAECGVVESSGEMVARGGKVHMLGEKVGLTDEGFIDVSHESGGGEVLLGGDYQGGQVLRSQLTFIEEDARIDARATEMGNGGKVIAWSDGGTVFFGGVNAEGGPDGGDGGFVEVSGVEHLNFSGRVSTWAPQGITGTLLLDPTDVTISASADSNATFAAGTYTYSASNANIEASALATNLASSDVIVSTTSTFSGAGIIRVDDVVSWASPNQLTLSSDGGMSFDLGTGLDSSGGGDIVLNVGGSLLNQGGAIEVSAGSGNISISTQGSCVLLFGVISGTQSNINLDIGGDLILGVDAGTSSITNEAGQILINVGGNLDLLGEGTSIPGAVTIGSTVSTGGSDVKITSVGGDLRLISGNAEHAIIGNTGNSTFGNVFIGDIGGDLVLQAGTIADSYAQIGHAPTGNNFLARGDVSIGPVHGKILIQGGTADDCQALIGHGFFGTANDGVLEGSISMTQEVVPATGNDLLIQSGAAVAATAGIGFVPTQGDTTVVSERVSVATNAPITLRTMDGDSRTVIGVFEFDLGSGSALIEEISVKTTRDLVLQAGNGGGNDWGGAIIGSRLTLPSVANSTINIEARDMYWLTAPLGIPFVINHSSLTEIGDRDVTITTRNAFVGVGDPDSVDAIIVAGRNMLLIADQDIQLGPSAILRAANGGANPPPPPGSGGITLVVDNAFPSSPDIGPGQFISNRGRIDARGPLRIFTAKRAQNSIDGPIKFDGGLVFFAPGPILLDTSTEHWGSYFPDSFGGFPYTIFYKEALPPFVNLYGRAISDMFKNLATYDEFLFAPKCFLLGFDMLCYDEPLHLHGKVSSFDLFHDRTYQLLRPRYRNYQTKYVESF